MTEPWLYAEPGRWRRGEILLPPDESRHALKVLRVEPPDVVTVTDGRGTVARCAAARTEGDALVVQVLERFTVAPARPQVVVYQGAAKGAKLDAAVERLAELGVAECWVFASERAVPRWDAHKQAKHAQRWSALARAAAKVARSPHLMEVGATLSWTELVRRIAREPVTMALWEEASLPLRTAFVDPIDRVALVVGPEGGLTHGEAHSLADAGAQLVSLGPRIMRTENAAVIGASAVLFHYGLIG